MEKKKVFEELITTLTSNVVDGKVSISNVDLFLKSWRAEFKMAEEQDNEATIKKLDELTESLSYTNTEVSDEEIREVAEKFHSDNGHRIGTYHVFIKGAKWMRSKLKSQWISVEEKLPKSLQNVIVFYDDNITGYVSRGFCHSNPIIWDVQSYKGTKNPKVTHWMPLPESPIK